MDLHLFDLNLLVALDALLTERNVTRAGNRLNLSQSAMSGALARLRHYFHDELLVPVGRQMVLTPMAEGLVGPVRDILLQIRGTLGSKPQFDPATATRHLSLAVSDYVTEILMADVLRAARCEAPHITFELRPVGRRAGEDLESGELDFLIAPEGYVSSSQPTDVLFEDTYTCVVWAGSKAVGKTITLEQYLELGHVVVNVAGNEPPANYDEQFLRRANFKRRVEVSVPTFSLAPQLVVGTDRVATITTRLAAKCAEILPLRLLPLPIAMPPMVEMLQWHKVHEYDPAHHWFRGLLRTVVQQLPSQPPVIRGGRAARVSARS
ncbi:MAG TPA: LysR family transcriptional regulator [Vicinamibacterales bacterium]|jgi:DNA-binding transcriptional LysR family regulator|nr:LysR family transcriptional regulator [Vicinamibacterales bacterium]